MSDSISGIYKITNKVNGKVYIGQTYDMNYRWTHHKSDLNHNRHHNIHLQNAWNIYGQNNFDFAILEKCSVDQLDAKEQFWIKQYDSCAKGYNLDCGGLGVRGYKHTEAELFKMHRIQNPKIVMQFDMDFNLIQEWIGGVSHINKTLKYTKECILLRCEHRILNKMTPYKNSYWIYKDEYESDRFSWNQYMNNVQYPEEKIICQYDTSFNLVKEWYHRQDLRDSGYNLKSIFDICNHSSSRRLYLGYIWEYKDYDFSDGRYGFGDSYKYKHVTRKINMLLEKNGDIVKTFNSIVDACDYLNRPHSFRSNIIGAIQKQHRASGYYWEYVD